MYYEAVRINKCEKLGEFLKLKQNRNRENKRKTKKIREKQSFEKIFYFFQKKC